MSAGVLREPQGSDVERVSQEQSEASGSLALDHLQALPMFSPSSLPGIQ